MELIDLYDKNRMPLNQTIDRRAKYPSGTYFVYMHTCVFNSEGKMLIQQRSHSKKTWPGLWDVSLSGGVRAGEKTRDSAHREMLEELGIDIDMQNETACITMNDGVCFSDFFIVNADVDLAKIKFEDGEVEQVKWADQKEILKLIKKKQFVQYQPSFISLLFDQKDIRGIFQKGFL